MQYYDSTIDHLKRTVPQIGKFYELEEYFKKFKILKNKNINKININNNKIIFKNVTVKYDKNIILDNISLEIKENSKTGIMGQIGKGKTTILKIIAGLVNYIGLVEIDNKNLKNYEYDSIIKYVGYASQHAKLFNKDIYYNLTYGTNKSEKDIWKILKQLNLDKFYNNFPNKLKTLVGKDGSKLSGGQRQIILITRILIQNKKIILLDEPTSSLDSNIKKLMIDLLKNIKNKTLIIVTHDNDLIELFDEIIRL
jgi:ABC-type bacteriocin/lantibiotic exporter with double-glycine peptidase domain